MDISYTREIKKTGIYVFLLGIVLVVYYYFSDFWGFARSNTFLNENVVSPVETFLYSFESETIVISVFLIFGVIITIILSLLIARQILKISKKVI